MTRQTLQASFENTLDDLRRQIDDVDDALLKLLAERCGLVRRVQSLKRSHGIPEHSPRREQEIFDRAEESAYRLGLPGDGAVSVLRKAIRCSLLAAGVSVHDRSAGADDD